MHNNRELQLQTIIKTLQSKVHSLKRQLTLVQQNEQNKLAEALHKERTIIQEKERSIQTLMESIKKLKQTNMQKQSVKMTQMADNYFNTEANNQELRSNNNNLEQQMAEKTENYEKILAKKEDQLKQAKYACQILQKERKKWLEEAQKLNRFYVQATRRQPQRQETLLWVDKLIQFMTKASEIVLTEKKERNEAFQNIKRCLKDEFYQLTNAYNKNESQIATQRASFLKEIQKILQQAESDCKAINKSNQQFWQTLNKAKGKEEKQGFLKLEQQFQSYRYQKQKQIQDLNEVLTNSEKQKKTLLVGLQQIKSYYQLREKAYKEECDQLKQTISDLIQSQELREAQFQEEIKRLSDQIQHLTVRFYQKIELPINAVYSKIKQEVEKFKNHFEGFFTGSNFQTELRQFHTKIVQYLVHLNQHKVFRDLVKDSAQQCLKIAAFLKTNQKGYSSLQNSSVGTFSSLIYQSGIVAEGNKQKQQKLNYELATVKKQLQKMKQHAKELQKKAAGKTGSVMNSKLIQLMAENEMYKQRIQKLQRNQREGFNYNQQVLEESRIGRINTAIIQRLLEKCDQLLVFTQKQEDYIIQLSSCINSLNLIIINPLQTFQNLVKQVKNISSLTFIPPIQQQHKTIQKIHTFDVQNKKQLYREIMSKKNQATSNIQKSNLQLMKVIRQFLSKNSFRNMKDSQQKLPERFKNHQSRQLLQKRLKEAHNLRLKSRQQFVISLRQLQEKMKNIQLRYAKKQSISFSKYEDTILKAIQQVSKIIEPKQKFKEMKKIIDEALLDTKSKLKDCQLQNQGLLHQIQLIKSLKLTEKPTIK